MQRSVLLAAALLALPAQPMAQSNDPVARELRRAQQNPTSTPWVPEQNRGAADADAAGIDDVVGLIQAAQTALRANRRGQAVEFMERAEARLLTRSTPAPQAGTPAQGGPIGRVGSARRATLAGDYTTARKELEAALDALNRPRRPGR